MRPRVVLALATPLLALAVSACDRRSSAGQTSGAEIFQAACARCHGKDGGGGLPVPTGQTPRNFHDLLFQSSRSDADIRATIQHGKPPGMPSFAAVLSERDLDELVRQVRSFGGPQP